MVPCAAPAAVQFQINILEQSPPHEFTAFLHARHDPFATFLEYMSVFNFEGG